MQARRIWFLSWIDPGLFTLRRGQFDWTKAYEMLSERGRLELTFNIHIHRTAWLHKHQTCKSTVAGRKLNNSHRLEGKVRLLAMLLPVHIIWSHSMWKNICPCVFFCFFLIIDPALLENKNNTTTVLNRKLNAPQTTLTPVWALL